MNTSSWTIGIVCLGALPITTMVAGEHSAQSVRAPASPVTFAEHIAPIVFDNCATCHRPGEAAPFSLLTYDDVARRGRVIAAVTKAKVMPPWKAAPSSYPFRDERGLTDEQIALIQSWVEQGMPKGDLAKTPPLPTFPTGWQLGPPDLVVEMPVGYRVPADGPDVYRSFVLPLGLTEDKWVRAIELRPSSRSVVHHVLYFGDTTGAAKRADAADEEPGFSGMRRGGLRSVPLGGWALGQQPHPYPDGVAMALPKNSDLVLQYHFHPTGKVETEQSVVGVYFATRAPERNLAAIQLPVLFGLLAGVDIPAGDPSYRVEDAFVLPVDIEGVAIGAHAHYLGRELEMTATLPSGERKTLLSIKDWDFAWQDRYFFEQLVPLPASTRLEAHVIWDNSSANRRNPSNPPVRVHWGEQSTDEMGSVTLQVIPRRQEDLATLQSAYRRHIAAAAVSPRGAGQEDAAASEAEPHQRGSSRRPEAEPH